MVNLNVAAVDLFCGIGGLTHGLIKVGIPVVASWNTKRGRLLKSSLPLLNVWKCARSKR